MLFFDKSKKKNNFEFIQCPRHTFYLRIKNILFCILNKASTVKDDEEEEKIKANKYTVMRAENFFIKKKLTIRPFFELSLSSDLKINLCVNMDLENRKIHTRDNVTSNSYFFC